MGICILCEGLRHTDNFTKHLFLTIKIEGKKKKKKLIEKKAYPNSIYTQDHEKYYM